MTNAKILIVEDEQDTRQVLAEYISARIMCETFQAPNGYEAIELIKKSSFDLILLDIKMPGINGMEVLEKVKEISPETEIIVITKAGSKEREQRIKELGAVYMAKPFSLKFVQKNIEEKLEGKNKLQLK